MVEPKVDDDGADDLAARVRVRREPPPLRPVTVVERTELTPRLLRLTFEGPDMAALDPGAPAGSVRLLVPGPAEERLVLPRWNGNEFLLPDGTRPALRTFTPLRIDAESDRLDLEIVRHERGAVSGWAETAGPGAPAALSGPGRGYDIDADATGYLLLGDETALPALAQVMEAVPPGTAMIVHVEAVAADATIELPSRRGGVVHEHVLPRDAAPGATLVGAVRSLPRLDAGVRVWAAGEAAAMQAIRVHLFDELGCPRSQATVRGYWKVPR